MTISEKGRYQFECRRFPRPPTRRPAHRGPRSGSASKPSKTDLVEGDKKATFELTLEAGDYDLEAWFANGKKRFGALWVYVEKL